MSTLRGKIDEICIPPINSTIWHHNDVRLRHYVNRSGDEYVIMCNFGGRTMSDFGAESNKRNKNGLNRVKMFYKIENGVDTNLVDCF